MKYAALLVALLALIAFGYMSVDSQARSERDYQKMLDDARSLRELDATLDKAALAVEGGLVLNYDALGLTLREMHRRQASLERTTSEISDPELARRVKDSGARAESQERVVEDFESLYSVFRNSSLFLPIASKRAVMETASSPLDDEVASDIASLLAESACRAECDESSRMRLEATVTALAREYDRLPPEMRTSLSLVLRHARLFAIYGPKVDAAIDAVLAADGTPYDAVFDAVQANQARAAIRANRVRIVLGLACVSLVLVVAYMIFRLGKNATALTGALSGLAAEKKIVEEKQAELAHLNRSLESRVDQRTRELTKSHEQYRLLLETSRAIPWEMSADSFSFAYVGPQAVEMLGYRMSEWADSDFLTDHLVADERQASLAHFVDGPEHDEFEIPIQAADGREVWLRCYVTRTMNERGASVRRGLFFDVTGRRVLEADLRAAQKLEGIGRLASGIAHEINTPVQFVGDNVAFLRDAFRDVSGLIQKYRTKLDPEDADIRDAEEAADLDYVLQNLPDAFQSSVDGLDRIATIVRSMKEFSHPDRKEKVMVDLNANIRSTVVIAQTEFKHVAQVELDLGEIPQLRCHPGEINQVVLNMLVNAAHAIGDVEDRAPGKLGTIRIRTRQEADTILVSISDTGGGIPVAHRERLFEPFFTTKEVGRGTGQGLAIARTIIVDKHSGQLTFESEVGQGSTFYVRLPVDAELAASAA